jgi:hypothetical protein
MLIVNIKLKILATFLPILVMAISVPPARAGRAEPISVSCWFFRGDKVELKQTCVHESHSWAGGGVGTLRWEDGVQTKIYRGFQENGDKPCGENESIDGVCAVRYFRHPTSLSRPEGNSKHLTFVPKDVADKNYRIIFETTFDRVREFRSGKLPEVEFIEGCL